jgi:DNA polymerase III epsilon subunit family exonuclease
MDANPVDSRYDALTDRALGYIRDNGGSVHEDQLVRHVFGSSGSPAIWRPLLRGVLASEVEQVVLINDHWSLIRAETVAGATILRDFIAIDVETTGLKPVQHRTIEIALHRYIDGKVAERFETFVNPGRVLPRFITELTGIRDEDLEYAPVFGDVADRIVEFLGDALLVGHNIRFDLSFLNQELRRAGREKLFNPRIDTLTLAMRYLKQVRKPSLDRVAAAVGIPPRSMHRAGGDAQMTAEAALRLVEIASRTGVTSLEDLKAGGGAAPDRPRDGVGRARSVLDRAWLNDIPRKPGVYVMYGQVDEIIYVGKAKNLRERLSSYYSQPIGMTRKMDGLIESMSRIETEVVGTELQALILESQLIHRYQPRYNVALKSFEHYPYVRVDIGSPWPRITAVKERKDDGARYYGPYRSGSGVRKTIEVVSNAVGLRTCTRSFKTARSYGRPCLKLDLGTCLGPCVGQSIRDEYMAQVRDVIAFLDGDEAGLRARLWRELELAAENLDFERARKLRGDLQSALALIEEQDRLRTAEQSHNLLLVQPSADPESREVLVILRGQIWAQVRVARIPEIEVDGFPLEEESPRDDQVSILVPGARPRDEVMVVDSLRVNDLSDRLQPIMERYAEARHYPLDHYGADEAGIINRWLFRNTGHPSILPLDMDRFTDRGYLVSLSLKVLALTEEALESVVSVEPPAAEPEDDPADEDQSSLPTDE